MIIFLQEVSECGLDRFSKKSDTADGFMERSFYHSNDWKVCRLQLFRLITNPSSLRYLR
jgi:hypothetical protein